MLIILGLYLCYRAGSRLYDQDFIWAAALFISGNIAMQVGIRTILNWGI